MSFSGTGFASKKALTSAAYHIDPKYAERYAHERYLLTDCDQCVDPNTLTFDQYHRQADPYTLTRTQQGNCSALDPLLNLQNWLVRENNVDRTFIHHDLAGGYMYDTLGLGRNLQQTYTGGTEDGKGGWYRINMPREAQGSCDNMPDQHYHTDSCRGNKTLGVENVYRYNG